jgi:hypothetical protein
MKQTFLLLLFVLFSGSTYAQEAAYRNAFSVSYVRFESNSQTMYGSYHLKFVSALEYERSLKNWSFGIEYERGTNTFEEDPPSCYDCFYGTSRLREDNVYLTSNCTFLKLVDAKLSFRTGLGVYYSNSNYTGSFQGGISGGGSKRNSTFNTLGFSPSISIVYAPISQLFFSFNANLRYGWSKEFNSILNNSKSSIEIVRNVAELKIGIRF